MEPPLSGDPIFRRSPQHSLAVTAEFRFDRGYESESFSCIRETLVACISLTSYRRLLMKHLETFNSLMVNVMLAWNVFFLLHAFFFNNIFLTKTISLKQSSYKGF